MEFLLRPLSSQCLNLTQADAHTLESMEEVDQLWKVGAFTCVIIACSLEGCKCFYTSTAGLQKHITLGHGDTIPPHLTKTMILTKSAGTFLVLMLLFICRTIPTGEESTTK